MTVMVIVNGAAGLCERCARALLHLGPPKLV